MKHLKLFENFDNELEQDGFISSNLEDDYDEKLEQDLSVELEYKLRTLSDESNLKIDDFLMEFGINPEDMTGFAWAAILNGTEKFKEMSDDEFMEFYDNYNSSLSSIDDEIEYDEEDINEATQGSVDNKSSKAYKSLKKKLNESKSDEVISSFEEADKKGSVSVNLDYLGKDWYKNTKDYHLYDNFYLYNNSIFELNTFPSGDWYASRLSKHKEPPHVFKDKIFEKIQELEKAFNMLD